MKLQVGCEHVVLVHIIFSVKVIDFIRFLQIHAHWSRRQSLSNVVKTKQNKNLSDITTTELLAVFLLHTAYLCFSPDPTSPFMRGTLSFPAVPRFSLINIHMKSHFSQKPSLT